MDCCEKNIQIENKKGGDKVKRRIVMWIVIGILFLVALFITFKTGAGSQVIAQSGNIAGSASSSAMVGGC